MIPLHAISRIGKSIEMGFQRLSGRGMEKDPNGHRFSLGVVKMFGTK